MVSGAGRLGRGRTAGRPGSLTGCAHRQRRGAAPAAVAEEERCTVERRADLSYAEFVQQYVRLPGCPASQARKPAQERCHALTCLRASGPPRLPLLDLLERMCGDGNRDGSGQTLTLLFLLATPSPNLSFCRDSQTTQ